MAPVFGIAEIGTVMGILMPKYDINALQVLGCTVIQPGHALTISEQVLSAVRYIHCLSISHNDIKLENVLMNFDGSVKLTDFSSASSLSGRSTTYSKTGQGFVFFTFTFTMSNSKTTGTTPYIAPEITSSGAISNTATCGVGGCCLPN